MFQLKQRRYRSMKTAAPGISSLERRCHSVVNILLTYLTVF